jgi:hypothetical protein
VLLLLPEYLKLDLVFDLLLFDLDLNSDLNSALNFDPELAQELDLTRLARGPPNSDEVFSICAILSCDAWRIVLLFPHRFLSALVSIAY